MHPYSTLYFAILSLYISYVTLNNSYFHPDYSKTRVSASTARLRMKKTETTPACFPPSSPKNNVALLVTLKA